MKLTGDSATLFILDPEELSCQMKKLFFRSQPIGDVLTYRHHRFHRTVRGQFGNNACPVVSATIFNGSMDRFLFFNRLIAARFKVLPVVILERDLAGGFSNKLIGRNSHSAFETRTDVNVSKVMIQARYDVRRVLDEGREFSLAALQYFRLRY